jgi:hypothetical protein
MNQSSTDSHGESGLEGRDNFGRNFTTSFEGNRSEGITRHAQVYVVNTVSIGDRPLGPEVNLPGTGCRSVGAAVSVRPSIALMAKSTIVSMKTRGMGSRTGHPAPVFGFGLQKASASAARVQPGIH